MDLDVGVRKLCAIESMRTVRGLLFEFDNFQVVTYTRRNGQD
jgi:hypothetical protein